jgi:hypothetical protein
MTRPAPCVARRSTSRPPARPPPAPPPSPGLPLHRDRPGLRLAKQRDRGDGRRGCGELIFRREINSADDPETVRKQKIKEYRTQLMHPYYAAERGLIDDIIDPVQTRRILIDSLAMLRDKHADLPSRKHGNPPQ